MTRKTSLWAVTLVLALVVAGHAQDSEFFMKCDSCGSDDSGTASGDGEGTVAPSNGSKGFTGLAPSYSSIGLKNGKDLRFEITAAVPTPNDLACGTQGACNYDAVLVNRLKFFVSAIRTPLGTPSIPALYCATNRCATYNEIRLGSTLGVNGDLRAVVYVTDVLVGGGVEIEVGDSETLLLSKAQWQELNRIVGAVKAVDHDNVEFFLGLAVSTTAVDSPPLEAVPVHFVDLQRYMFIRMFSNK